MVEIIHNSGLNSPHEFVGSYLHIDFPPSSVGLEDQSDRKVLVFAIEAVLIGYRPYRWGGSEHASCLEPSLPCHPDNFRWSLVWCPTLEIGWWRRQSSYFLSLWDCITAISVSLSLVRLARVFALGIVIPKIIWYVSISICVEGVIISHLIWCRRFGLRKTLLTQLKTNCFTQLCFFLCQMQSRRNKIECCCGSIRRGLDPYGCQLFAYFETQILYGYPYRFRVTFC